MMGLVFAALMTVQVVQPAATEDPVVCAVDTAAQMARPWAQFEFDTEAPGGPMALARGKAVTAPRLSSAGTI